MFEELYQLCKNPPSPKDWNRFWVKVKIADWRDCWEWQAGRVHDGYGRFAYKTDSRSARILMKWIHGALPRNWHADHRVCNNPPCTNPLHLIPCGEKENIAASNCASSINARKEICDKCKNVLSKGKFQRYCASCRREYQRKWEAAFRKTEKGRQCIIEANQRYNAKIKKRKAVK